MAQKKTHEPWPTIEELEEVLYERKEGIAKITINKPDRMNAISDLTMRELAGAITYAGQGPDVGVVVLTGAGDRAFTVGGDVAWEKESGGRRLPGGTSDQLYEAIRKCPKPVIAAIKGWCIGGGNHFAYNCDLTIAADNAIFGQNGPRIGSPADGYMLSSLISVVGQKRAREIWFLCRRYTAQEALEMGLINKVVPLDRFDEEVEKWCKEILALSPTCLKIAKASFNQYTDHLRASQYHFRDMIAGPFFAQTEEAREAQNAFMEKRQPDFSKFRK